MTNNPDIGGTSSDQFLLLLKQHWYATLFCLFVCIGHAKAWNTFWNYLEPQEALGQVLFLNVTFSHRVAVAKKITTTKDPGDTRLQKEKLPQRHGTTHEVSLGTQGITVSINFCIN